MMKSNIWKRLLCSILLLSTTCSAVSCKRPPDNSSDDNGGNSKPPAHQYDTVINEVIITAGNDRLAVNFCRDDVVHFRFAPDGEEFVAEDAVPESIAKFDNEYDAVYGEIETTETSTIIRTAGVVVTVNNKTLAFSISDSEGNPVFESAAKAFSVDGEGKKVAFVRDTAGTEHFYGLGNAKGDEFTTTDHRNTVYDLWLHDDNVHAIIPLWYSSSGYGIYLNNSNRGSISFTKNYSLSVEGGELNFYFFYGPSFKTILTNWSELAGRMNMPPLYSLGLTYRGYSSWTEDQLIDAITAQFEAGIAIDIAGVEPGWQTATYPCSYAWSTKFTTNAAAFVQRAHDLGLHVNLWEHPYVSPSSSIYQDILEYSLTGSQIGTRDWEGRSGNYAFGTGIVPDLTLEDARDLYWSVHNTNMVSIGVDGFKVDETDSWGASNSLDLLFPSGISNNAYHNVLGTLTVNLLHEKYRDEYNLRTFMYSRGNYSGMQRYATSAYTDYYGFEQFVMSVIAQSYSGTYYSPEIRDTSTKNDISYMRRAQLMFLTPFAMSNEYATQATVLGRSQAVINCYIKYNQLHYKLIPYMYSLFWNQYNTGIGVTRSLILEFQDDPKVYDIDTQFMLGDSLMVCPVSGTDRIATVDIYLPAGETWMDYNNGYIYQGGQTIEYTCSASTLPLFVRMGSILPLGHYGNNTSDVVDTTLTLDIYPSADKASFVLYEDDGSSYDYQNGEYAETLLTAQLTGNSIVCTVGARTGNYDVDTRACVLQLHYRSLPASVTLDGKAIPAVDSLEAFNNATEPCYYYDANATHDIDKIIYVRLTDDGKEHTVVSQVGEQGAQDLPTIVLEGKLYECEANTNTLVGAKVNTKLSASGKAVVTNIGNDGANTLTMNNITISKDGIYDVEIMYYNGDPETRMLYITINDDEVIPVHCYTNNTWGEVMTVTIPLSLKAGNNTLTFGTAPGKGSAPDLDCIIVYDDEPTTITMTGNIFTPEDAVLGGGLVIEKMTGAVGGSAVNGFADSSNGSMTYTVTAPKEGPYQLNINYSSTSLMAPLIDLTVNGSTTQIKLPSTKSTHIFSTLNLTIYLKAGENTVSLGYKGGPTIYECELGSGHTECTKQMSATDGLVQSGGYCVGSMKSGPSKFNVTVNAPEAGVYKVHIYAASGDQRTFRVAVNGKETGELYAIRTGHFHKFQAYELELELKKGDNTITIFGHDPALGEGDTQWMPNFDYIILPEVKEEIDIRIGAISIE